MTLVAKACTTDAHMLKFFESIKLDHFFCYNLVNLIVHQLTKLATEICPNATVHYQRTKKQFTSGDSIMIRSVLGVAQKVSGCHQHPSQNYVMSMRLTNQSFIVIIKLGEEDSLL